MPLKKESNIKDAVKNMVNNSVLQSKSTPKKLDDGILIKFATEDKELLKRHFAQKGTNLSNGIRMLVYEYMQKNDLI